VVTTDERISERIRSLEQQNANMAIALHEVFQENTKLIAILRKMQSEIGKLHDAMLGHQELFEQLQGRPPAIATVN